MMSKDYDAIVVGARCGGSPTAMLLARRGYRVLLVDKATFPSDTMSTHLVASARGGRARAVGDPRAARGHRLPADHEVLVRLRAGHHRGHAAAGGRRDARLRPAADRARRAAGRRGGGGRGRDARGTSRVEEILVEDGRVTGIRGHAKGGATVTERARVVIGADGKHSLVAKAVQPERYNETPALAPAYYAYWSDLPTDALRDLHPRRGRTAAGRPSRRTTASPAWSSGLAAVAVRGQPQGRGGHLHEVVRARARVRRADRRRQARDALRGHGRPAGLLPQALRPGMGARR